MEGLQTENNYPAWQVNQALASLGHRQVENSLGETMASIREKNPQAFSGAFQVSPVGVQHGTPMP